MSEKAAAAGITITVDRVPDDGYWDNVWMKKPFCAGYWGGRPVEDQMFTTAYRSGASWNESFWSNETFDRLLVAARSELDDARRREMYREMQRLVSFEGSTIIPMYNNYVMAVANAVATPEKVLTTGTWTASAASNAGGSPDPANPRTGLRRSASAESFSIRSHGGARPPDADRTGGMMSEIWRMIGRRLLLGVLTLFVISLVIFGATELLPGDLARELLANRPPKKRWPRCANSLA